MDVLVARDTSRVHLELDRSPGSGRKLARRGLVTGRALGAVAAREERRQRSVAMRVVREVERAGRVTGLAAARELTEVDVVVARAAFVRDAFETRGRPRPRRKGTGFDLVAQRARHLLVAAGQRETKLRVHDILDGKLRGADGVASLAR